MNDVDRRCRNNDAEIGDDDDDDDDDDEVGCQSTESDNVYRLSNRKRLPCLYSLI